MSCCNNQSLLKYQSCCSPQKPCKFDITDGTNTNTIYPCQILRFEGDSVVKPELLSGNVIKYSITAGASGQVLQTDPSGQIVWASVTGTDTTTTLVESSPGVYTYTNEDSIPSSIDICQVVIDNCNTVLARNPDGSLEFTDNAGTTINIPASGLASVAAGTNITVTGDGTTATPYIISAAGGATPDGSETIVTAGTNVTLTGTGTNADPYIINSTDTDTIADGSETIVNAGTNTTITGVGTAADPYIVNAAAGAETDLVLTTNGDANGVALSGTADHTVDITLLSGDANNSLAFGTDGGLFYNDPQTAVTAGANVTVTGTGIVGDPFIINSTDTIADGSETIVNAGNNVTIAGAGTTVDPYIVNATAPAETPIVLTTDGDATGVTLGGTADHTVNIVLLSTDANNSLTLGTDGGLLYDDPQISIAAGTDIAINGAGTAGDPFVIDSTGAGNTSIVADTNANANVRTIATHDDGTGTVVNIEESITTLTDVDNGDGTSTITYTSEDGTTTAKTLCNEQVSKFSDEDGNETVLEACKDLVLDRTLHIGQGTVAADQIGISHADSDQADTGAVTTNHDRVVIGVAASQASGGHSGVYSGDRNVTTGLDTVIAGGVLNTNDGTRGGIVGGLRNNIISGNHAFAAGGQDNNLTGNNVAQIGSDRADITGDNSGSYSSTLATITGVTNVSLASLRSTIGGNRSATVASEDVTITGSKASALSSEFDVINGDNAATIATNRNTIDGSSSFAIGAGNNTVTGRDAGAVAHLRGTVDGNESVLMGGEDGTTDAAAARSIGLGGQFVQTLANDQVVMGLFNDGYGVATSNGAFIMGNGSVGARRNAHAMSRLGEHYIFSNTAVPPNIDATMGRIYVLNGALVYEGTSGTITTIAPA